MTSNSTQGVAQTSGIQIYLRLLQYTRRYWRMFAFGLFGFLLYAQTEWAAAQLIKYVIHAIESGDQSHKNLIPVLIVILSLVRGAGTFIGNYGIAYVGRNIVYSLRMELFDKMLRLPMHFYYNESPGHLASRIVFNVEQVTAAATESLKIVVREGFTVIGLLAYLFYTNWILSCVILIIGPLIGLLVGTASKRFRTLSKRIQNSMGDVTHAVSELVNGFVVVKTYSGEQYERRRFDKASRDNLRQGMKMVVTSSINTPVVQLIVSIALSVIIWIALQPKVMNISAGEFVALISAFGMLIKPLRQLTEVNERIQRGIAAAESVFEFVDLTEEQSNGNHAPERVNGDIRIQNVSFRYAPELDNVLHEVSLTIPAGKTVALVGRSGSGKSTLVNFLPRFFDIEHGQISIDGIDVKDYDLAALRKQIAIVSQKVILFNDTIANNIAYARNDITPEQIRAAANVAYADIFIDKLAEGYDTLVGQDGVQLSGGQRQRIAIARALLKDAPILILDEATSALDTESEFYIQSALDRIMQNRTTIVIAHRLSTIEKADLIAVIDQGRIVETGTHQELLARNGAYALLHSRQFRDLEEQGSEAESI